MSKVLVTGGAGKVGRWVVKLLAAQGDTVTACGRTPGQSVPGAEYRTLDITDAAAVNAMVGEHDRVIHLAAIPVPREVDHRELLRINVQGTYQIYAACADHGIDRIAVASSINALGHNYGIQRLPVRYFPIDEDHPQLLSDEYSFSKHLNEETARYFYQRVGLSSVCLRIPGVIMPTEEVAQRIRRCRDARPTAFSTTYWCTVDARDSARAFLAGIEAEYEGAHTLFINDSHNILSRPSRELAALVYPEVTEWRAPLEHDAALITCRRAKQVLGWEPRYSWRGVAAGAPVP